MIPFNLVACLGHVVSNGRRMAVTRERLEMFRLSVMQSAFCFVLFCFFYGLLSFVLSSVLTVVSQATAR